MIKVSVIVPVYNVEKYLRRCLDSIINQTLKDIEIICINDGSTDNSLKILEEYAQKDERIKLINQENQGISCVRNNGMKIATGEYIGFIDSDDFIDSDFYEKLYNKVTETGSDVACANIVRENNRKRNILINYKQSERVDDVREKILLAGMPKHCYVWNKIYNAKKLKELKIQFPDGMNYEDVAFSPQIIEQMGGLVTVPDAWYHYWKNPNSIVKTATDKNRADCIENHRVLYSYCDKYKVSYVNTRKYQEKKEYYCCGIKIMKVCKLRATTRYLLFGFIPIVEFREFS